MLEQFYNELQKWVDGGCPRNDVFSKRLGICSNLDKWMDCNVPKGQRVAHHKFLTNSFKEAGLHPTYPFNVGDMVHFNFEFTNEMLFQNSRRLKWIEKQQTEKSGGEVWA